ncbi:MAG: YcxB family protein [Rhodobacteraceae bacterium]|nr:YcxB family protein [Paracoccaceae bacterium]
MNAIEIKRDRGDRGDTDDARIARYLAARFYGRWSSILILGAAMVVVLAGILAVEFLLPRGHVPPNWLVAFAPLSFAVFAGAWLNTRRRNKLRRALNDAPIRRESRSVILSDLGIADIATVPGAAMPWRFVTGVVEYRDMVLLLLSPTEYIPLPVSGLPDGLDRAALLQQIAEWRKTGV